MLNDNLPFDEDSLPEIHSRKHTLTLTNFWNKYQAHITGGFIFMIIVTVVLLAIFL
jgi:hypothetical protein